MVYAAVNYTTLASCFVIVLAVVTTIVSFLLTITHKFTYVDTSNMITDKLMAACVDAMGENEYEIVSDWKGEGFEIDKPENVEKLIKSDDGEYALEIVTNGYSKKGIDILVAMNEDGSVKAVSVVTLGETPGVGTKVNDADFLGQFVGAINELTLVKSAPVSFAEIRGVTSATYSSKGVVEAANIAIAVYAEMRGAK